MKRWLVASFALATGAAVTVALLVLTDPSRSSVFVYVAAHDVQAGDELGVGALALARVPGVADPSLVFGRTEAAQLASEHATHDLAAGQLIQRTDVSAAGALPDSRVVFVPLKDVPPVAAGATVDLMSVVDSPDGPSVQPFATGVEVRGTVAGGLLVAVSSRQAAAFVYAGATMQLVAAVASPGAAPGSEVPISTRDQAVEVAANP